jgi:hypothetical protein
VKSDITALLVDCGVIDHAALKGFMQFLNSKKENQKIDLVELQHHLDKNYFIRRLLNEDLGTILLSII